MNQLIELGRAANKIVADHYFINEILTSYHAGQFLEMKGLIIEYGELEFFRDLYQFFEHEEWRRPLNKYLIYAGITMQYFKIYT